MYPFFCRSFQRPVPAFLLLITGALVTPHLLIGQGSNAHFSTSQILLPYTVANGGALDGNALAEDAQGDIFVADKSLGRITELVRHGNNYQAHTLISGLDDPTGLAVDAQATLYVSLAGQTNGIVRETPSGTQYQSTTIPVSGITSAGAIVTDRAGDLFLEDTGNNRVVKLAPAGSTWKQSTVPSSALSSLHGIAVDLQGDIFIADYGHQRLLKETPSSGGYTETVVDSSVPSGPTGVAITASGLIYVLGSSTVWQETPQQGGGYLRSNVPFTNNSVGDVVAIVADSRQLYLAGTGGFTLERLVQGGAALGDYLAHRTDLGVTLNFTFDKATRIGPVQVSGDFANLTDGSCSSEPLYDAGDTCSVNLFFAPSHVGTCPGAVTLTDNTGTPVAVAYLEGDGQAASLGVLPGTFTTMHSGFAHPLGVAVDRLGNVFVAESRSGLVYKEASGGGRTVVAQGLPVPSAVAVDAASNLFIAAADGVYRELLINGNYVQSRIDVGTGNLIGVALDGKGYLYTISSSSGDVRRLNLADADTEGPIAIGGGISNPSGLAVDSDGNVFVTDGQEGQIYRETLQDDGIYTQSILHGGPPNPAGISVTGNASVYVVSAKEGVIYGFVQQFDPTTHAPTGNYARSQEFFTGLDVPWGIALDQNQNLYFTTNSGNGSVIRMDLSDAPTLNFPATRAGTQSEAMGFSLVNLGNVPMIEDAQGPTFSSGFVPASGSCALPGRLNLAPGDACPFTVGFAPTAHASYAGNVSPAITNLANPAPFEIPVNGQGFTSDPTRTTITLSHNPIAHGLSVGIAVKVSDTGNASSVPTGNVMLTDSFAGVTTTLHGGAPLVLSGGKVSLSLMAGAPGTHTLTAHYAGVDASFAGSTFVVDLLVQ